MMLSKMIQKTIKMKKKMMKYYLTIIGIINLKKLIILFWIAVTIRTIAYLISQRVMMIMQKMQEQKRIIMQKIMNLQIDSLLFMINSSTLNHVNSNNWTIFIIYIEGAAKVERIITGLSVLDIDKGEHNSSYSQANHILATRFHEVEMMVYILCILNNKFKFY